LALVHLWWKPEGLEKAGVTCTPPQQSKSLRRACDGLGLGERPSDDEERRALGGLADLLRFGARLDGRDIRLEVGDDQLGCAAGNGRRTARQAWREMPAPRAWSSGAGIDSLPRFDLRSAA
jgi:hypothetical protein